MEPGTPEYHAARLASEGKESLAGLRKLVAGWISDARPGEPTDGYQKTLEILNQAQKKSDFKQLKPEPYLYRGEYRWPDPAKEAATPLTGEDLLQWDRPISEQPESVRRAVSELGIVGGNMELPAGGLDMSGGGRILDNRDGKVKPGSVAPYVLVSGDAKFDISEKDLQRMLGGSDDPTGEQIYTRLTAKLGDQNAASKALDALGAPGIRYLDGMSRDGGQGTYNYVMFDDKGIKLLERNGKPIEDFAARRAGKAKPYREATGQRTLQDVVSELEQRGITVDAAQSGNNPDLVTLSRIVVPQEQRGQGVGTQAMQDLIGYADEQGKTIALSPSADFGASSVDRLKDFYKRFGFVDNKGKGRDFEISESMYRRGAK